MIFHVGDRVAHPMHGAGIIDRIEKKKVGMDVKEYYVVKLPMGEMRVLIPVDSCQAIGVRPIVGYEEAESILNAIPALKITMTQNWNKRYRENMLRIKSGDLMEVAIVVKGLMTRESARGLSTGERKMLHSAKQILLSEMVMSLRGNYEELERRLDLAVS